MCTRDLCTRFSVNPRKRGTSIQSPSRLRGFFTAKILIGTLPVLLVSALAVSDCKDAGLNPGLERAISQESVSAMDSSAREIHQNPLPIVTNEHEGCVRFEFDRDASGTIGADESGAFRREMIGGIGVIALWTGEDTAACEDDDRRGR